MFQADLNSTNILLNEKKEFVGIYDMNLCGREVFLNYLMREIYEGDVEEELAMIFHVLETVKVYYQFSDLEKQTAKLLYRCIKPLWYTRIEELKELSKKEEIQEFLNRTEYYLTGEIDFVTYM